jgi:tetratricopeptide (TPR) repeat protein
VSGGELHALYALVSPGQHPRRDTELTLQLCLSMLFCRYHSLGLACSQAGRALQAIDSFSQAADLAECLQMELDPSCEPYRCKYAKVVPASTTLPVGAVEPLVVSQKLPFTTEGASLPVPMSTTLAQQFDELIKTLLTESSVSESTAESGPQALRSVVAVAAQLSTRVGLFSTSPASVAPSSLATNSQLLALCQKRAFRFSRVLLKTRTLALAGDDLARRGARDALRLRISATHERAKVLQLVGRHADAVADFTDVLVNCPSATAAYFRRGLSLRALRCYVSAADDLETARTMLPRDARFNVNYNVLQDIRAIVVNAAGEEPLCMIIGLEDERDGAPAKAQPEGSAHDDDCLPSLAHDDTVPMRINADSPARMAAGLHFSRAGFTM